MRPIDSHNRRPTPQSQAAPAVLAGAVILAASGILVVPFLEVGPLSFQMLQHLAVMNVLAPLVALALPQTQPARPSGEIVFAGSAQLFALWAWHAPALQQVSAGSAPVHLLLMALLGGAALWFWRSILAAGTAHGWRTLAALLLTGKLACLLGALLIFAPRDLYELPGLALALCGTGPSSLHDQQLAGLLMITACPLSYLVVGVVHAAGMLARLDASPDQADVAARQR